MKIEEVSIENGRVILKAANNIVTISGDIDQMYPQEYLRGFIDKVHTTALQEKIKEIEVDLFNLNFLNSNGIKELLRWVLELKKQPKDKRYKINFIYDESNAWQVASLPILHHFEPEQVILKGKSE
ncbi:MAG: hypothetical protein JW969_03860 [Spirochaetales bacterium]|nr:hypothetical protein [Spirochaetales bacterium]